jgi:predicted alpha/beta superfamily hydrolase
MTKSILIFILVLSGAPVYSQPDADFTIKSEQVKGVTYNMAVYLPLSYDTSKSKYPVLYCTDGAAHEMLIPALYTALRFAEEVKEIIIVEIACSDDSLRWKDNRDRDFTPSKLNKKEYMELTPENPDSAGGAGNFLNFIKLELIPYVESHYRADTNSRGYFGHSYGGLFGVYAMAVEPGLFKNFIIGSPSLWYDKFSLIDMLSSVEAWDMGINKVYVCVGEKEPADMLKSFTRLIKWLEKNKLTSRKLKSETIYGETHRSSVVQCLFSGMRFLYGH